MNNQSITSEDFLNILMIVDVALGDEELENGISKWLKIIYDKEMTSFELEELHKRINFLIQEKRGISESLRLNLDLER
jgi:hypothetical protein